MSAPASPAPGQSPIAGYLRINQIVPAIIPVSRTTFLSRVKDGAIDGSFPQPVKLGSGRAVFFKAEDIRAFVESYGTAPAVQ